MPEPHSADDEPTIILAHQQKAFSDLIATAKVCFSVDRRSMSVRLKTATLIVASTGLGKTHLCAAVAAKMGVPFYHASVGDWVLMGSSARGGAVTMSRIYSFLRSCRYRDGAVIMLDELPAVWDRAHAISKS